MYNFDFLFYVCWQAHSGSSCLIYVYLTPSAVRLCVCACLCLCACILVPCDTVCCAPQLRSACIQRSTCDVIPSLSSLPCSYTDRSFVGCVLWSYSFISLSLSFFSCLLIRRVTTSRILFPTLTNHHVYSTSCLPPLVYFCVCVNSNLNISLCTSCIFFNGDLYIPPLFYFNGHSCRWGSVVDPALHCSSSRFFYCTFSSLRFFYRTFSSLRFLMAVTHPCHELWLVSAI